MKDDSEHRLPRELVWDGAHVSDLALTAIADGQQEIVHPDAIQHADACEWCAGRMGRAALLSAAVGGAVVAMQPAAVSAKVPARHGRPAPAPWKALGLGIAVAVLAAIPSLPHFASSALDMLAYGKMLTAHGVPLLARGGVALATNETIRQGLPLATAVSSVLLVIMGWAIARTRSRQAFERSMS